MSAARTLPREVDCAGHAVTFRLMTPADGPAVLAFARRLPAHDLLFLRRDISHPKVIGAWIRDLDSGQLITLLAWRDEIVVGCATIVRDPLSWSAHVAELRIVISEEMRGRGLGSLLAQEAFAYALTEGAEKLFAQMTADQQGAIALFEGLGFAPEAILRDHVRGRDGVKHDLVVLSHDVARVSARHEAYGLNEAL